MERYAALGATLVMYVPFAPDPAAQVGRVCESVVPRLADVG